ncbi:hypothetical protein NDU88_011148 [Pleurodeles waltl]|uniref:Uncharacterized protein n=1 Tax=Pleurodeles waltl TaxID=8319 RepID=A0AAV7QWE4_PLEWA|nr:hypothetical protein NDU88_011148 [Pleurodeles waltl]
MVNARMNGRYVTLYISWSTPVVPADKGETEDTPGGRVEDAAVGQPSRLDSGEVRAALGGGGTTQEPRQSGSQEPSMEGRADHFG